MAKLIKLPRAKELEQITQNLDRISPIDEMVLQELIQEGKNPTSAKGMAVEQIVRAAITRKSAEGLGYDHLAFQLAYPSTYRAIPWATKR